ncbi:MAG: hypothetical protein ACXVEW_03455 [Solirubrobacteraceae bacterium]
MTTTRFNPTRRRAAATALGAFCVIAIPVSSANAATTLHLFAKTTENTFTYPSGKPILGHVPPPPAGSVLTNTGVEYPGTSKHHGQALNASTNIICFVTKAPKALCYGQIAIGGSMLLANRFSANLARSNPFSSIPINAGTGKFARAHGKLRATPVGSGTGINITITYST